MARGMKLWKQNRDRHVTRDAQREIREALLEKAFEVALRLYHLRAARH
jgi:hypothetical protein